MLNDACIGLRVEVFSMRSRRILRERPPQESHATSKAAMSKIVKGFEAGRSEHCGHHSAVPGAQFGSYAAISFLNSSTASTALSL